MVIRCHKRLRPSFTRSLFLAAWIRHRSAGWFPGRSSLYGYYGDSVFFILHSHAREVTGAREQPGCWYGIYYHRVSFPILWLADQRHLCEDWPTGLRHSDGTDRAWCLAFSLHEAF